MTNIFIGLKKTCLGVLDRGERDKDHETGLKEGGIIEMSTTVLHSRAAPSLEYLPLVAVNKVSPKLIPLISNTEGSKHLGPVPTTCDMRSACVKSLETRCSHSNGDSNRTHAKVLKTFGTIENI